MTASLDEALYQTPAATNLPKLIETLLIERGEEPQVPDGTDEQWRLFRALVNVRPPAHVSDEFLQLQDELLRGIIDSRGVTLLEDTKEVSADERIRIWRGDITTLATDAIVNAANSQMLGCFVPGHHCIDNAIHTFAGVQLRLECSSLMNEQGYPEPTGMSKITDAFNLPCKLVIHTVGPIAEGAPTESDCRLLANCYTSCLDAAEEAGCKSIAFCCISTGVFGFPQDQAAAVAVEAVRKWLDQHDSPMTVVFNVFSDRDESIYRRLLDCFNASS